MCETEPLVCVKCVLCMKNYLFNSYFVILYLSYCLQFAPFFLIFNKRNEIK